MTFLLDKVLKKNLDTDKINNATIINKTSNHLSLNTKNTMIYNIGNPGNGLGQAQTIGVIKPINGLPTFPSW